MESLHYKVFVAIGTTERKREQMILTKGGKEKTCIEEEENALGTCQSSSSQPSP